MFSRIETSSKCFSIWNVSTLYCGIGSMIFYLIATTEPTPYIDEIFHANQSFEYCQGNFYKYNPKITTPPGLYVITIIILLPLRLLTQIDVCTLNTFRFISFIFSQLLFFLIYRVIHFQIPHSSSAIKLSLVLNLCTLPVLYFYSFFYYTDVVSTFFVILTYHLYKINASHSAGFTGLLSVLIRQTNLVWFCCFAFIKCCKCVEHEAYKVKRLQSKIKKQNLSYILVILKESFHLARYSFQRFVRLILKETYLFIISSLVFIHFLFTNGCLVLGDKSAHEVVIHVPQLLYFSLFTSVFAFSLCIKPSFKLLRNVKLQKFRLALFTLVLTGTVAVNSMAHLYLISDNRHYTFYIWKRIFEKPLGKFIMIPFYIMSIYSISENISHFESYTKIAYFLSTALCLVPQKLLEFRYFIIPYLIYRLETFHRISQWLLWLELLLSMLINYATIWLFLQKPYNWPDGSRQRFSW